MRALLFSTAFFLLSLLTNMAAAQDQVWIQIEAHPNQSDAEARADVYSQNLDPIEAYRLSTGWHAILVGPLSSSEAVSTLRQLRITRQIPSDSYIVDGTTFRGQFWPPLGSRTTTTAAANTTATTPAPVVEPEPAPQPEPVDETPAEARRSEALLNEAERKELQSALAWEGFYASAIDGAIGRGSRNAMAEWQIANGYDATGILTTRQRTELLSGYRALLASIGMAPYYDDVAGIEMELPLAVIEPDGYAPPMVHFTPKGDSGADVFLISQSGDRVTMSALYEVLQTLRIVPLDGPRSLQRTSFSIEGRDQDNVVTIYAEIAGDDVKGYGLIWPTGDEERRELVWSRMQASFQPVAGRVLPDDFGTSFQSSEELAGLAIRQPERSQSGFYVSERGEILTTADQLANCSRITVGLDDAEARLQAQDTSAGLALLTPKDDTRPISVAQFSPETPGLGSEVAIAGYSYGGKLGSASLAFGTLTELSGLNAEPELRRLQLDATDGDVGGPIVDVSGAVLGMLQPAGSGSRVLPQGVHLAVGSERLAQFLSTQGVSPQNLSERVSYRPDELAMRTADFTVLVNCWN